MRGRRYAAACLAAVLLPGLCSGCAGNTVYTQLRDVESLELVRTVGVDREEQVTVTVVTGLSAGGDAPITLQEQGATLAEAMHMLEQSASRRRPFYSHTEYLVLGQSAAEAGILGYLDYFGRMLEMRTDTGVYLVRDGDAAPVLHSVCGGKDGGDRILAFLKEDLPRTGQGYVATCLETAVSLERYGCALVMAIRLRPGEEPDAVQVRPAGFGVLENGRLTAFLSDAESRGVCVLQNRVREMALVTDDGQGGKISLQLGPVRTAIVPVFANGALVRLDAQIRSTANITEMASRRSAEDPAVRARIASQVEEQLTKWAQAAVDCAQRMGLDFLALGGAAARKAPVRFAAVQAAWPEVFPKLDVAVTAQVEVIRSYDMDAPLSGGPMRRNAETGEA